MSQLAVVGAGPHGREIAHVLRARHDVALVDDFLPGYERAEALDDIAYVAGAAWPAVKAQIAAKMDRRHRAHHRGVVVFPGARIGEDVWLGDHVHVNYNAVVSHGCSVGDYSTISPGAVLSGDVELGERCFVGANATIIHGGIFIGDGCLIGAGAVVVRDVKPNTTVVGVPARPL